MSNAVAVATLTVQTFPLATVAGPILFELLANNAVIGSQSITQTAADVSSTATFSNVSPGTYIVRVTRQDGAGNALAPPALSAAFTVAASTTTITVPASVSVTVQ